MSNEIKYTVIQSAFRIKGTEVILLSQHVHDFFQDARAPDWFIDGGNDYLRVGFPSEIKADEWSSLTENLTLTENSSIKEIIEKTCWGNRGKDNKSPLQYKLIRDMELDHIKAVIDYLGNNGSKHVKLALMYWYGYRTGYNRGSYSVNY